MCLITSLVIIAVVGDLILLNRANTTTSLDESSRPGRSKHLVDDNSVQNPLPDYFLYQMSDSVALIGSWFT
ncbi:hypothetical protein L596_004322 [Steinernema carpocapsae]|uniref:Uncharacterized protein n=1 Tax=Steinernema carpocapsae TaxID=34508 RepID=A0A4U8UVE0_STECR|nr:hypothetical protein L596_004322 [Steinernema carpocapsae]